MDWRIFRPSRATALCLFLLAFSFLMMTLRLTNSVKAFRSFLFYWISPTQETATASIHGAGGQVRRLAELVSSHRENVVLRERVRQLSLLESQYQELLTENERLKAMLKLKADLPFEMAPAIVSGRDAQNWTQAVWIDRGLKDEIEPDSPVVAVQSNPSDPSQIAAGLVGRVLECGPNTSKVLLISDPLSSVAVGLPRTNEQGLISGQGSFQVIVEYLDPQSPVEIGDPVMTSGLGGIFPPGIPVGKIEQVFTSPLGFKKAYLSPAIRMNAIHEVMVLRRPGAKASAARAE